MAVQQTTQDGVAALLSDPKYELMPFDSFDEEIAYLPEGARIPITTSPQLGIDRTVEKTEDAVEDGFEPIPHIAARYVEDEDHLDEIASRLTAAGIEDIFVPGGDKEDPGAYESSYELLVALDDLGYEFGEVGITGYPEGHSFIDDETLEREMEKKAPYADYIVTQLCYDPETIVDWVETVRADRDIDHRIDVGIPGVMKYEKLIKISTKVGVGDSVQFLKKTTGIVEAVKQFISSRGRYRPDDLMDGLAPYTADPEYNLGSVHIYTFNQTKDVEAWRQKRLQ